MSTRFAVILLVLLGLASSGFAQSDRAEPAWLVIERADQLMQEGEFGLAIRDFRLALQLQPGDPEAFFGLGRAYKALGDLAVAEDYLAQALDARGAFRVPDRAFLVRYERAEIYRTRRDFARYEQELATLVDEDPPPDDALVPDNLRSALSDQGIDRFLVLYRLRESPSTRASGMLGELLVGLGQYNGAAEYAATAVLQGFTTLIEAALDRDPTYEFESVESLMDRVARYPEARAYLASATLYHDLYYLAAAFWGERNLRAIALWEALAAMDPSGSWGARAGRQADNPRDEPLLVPTR